MRFRAFEVFVCFVVIIVEGMVILALDTTTRGGSCALVNDDGVMREEAGDPEQPQAGRLPGDLVRLLQLTGMGLGDVDVFAVASGPGLFTGLRIGIATMQGLALAGGKPLIGKSALDALAALICQPDPTAVHDTTPTIHTWMDAWRGEVYAATYAGGRNTEPPVVSRPSDLLGRMDEADAIFIGDGAATHRELILSARGHRARIADPAMPRLAASIGRLAMDDVRAGKRPAPHAIVPVYVRRPDAELARDKR